LGGRKGIRPVKKHKEVGWWRGSVWSEMQTCMAQLMPLPLNHSLSLALGQITYWTLTSLNITETIIDSQKKKKQIGFTYLALTGSPG